MRNKLRQIRLFPVFALGLGAYLFYWSFSHRIVRIPSADLTRGADRASEKGVFAHFAAGLYADSTGGEPRQTFTLLPHEKERSIYCRPHFQLKEGESIALRFSWFRRNNPFAEEERALKSSDTALTVHCTIPRGEAGFFSLDISTPEGNLLQTLPFNVTPTLAPTPYKSLKNAG